ncbi:pimeloyl-ACP methyl ester carboxylesterase [Paenibacillus sp. DS2015]|uniref:alpha/beta fold hydrolase n=1 Tax=Paenibacillus sp. DS2015 TaxID=3373917 RepID=UPI003D22B51E
MKKVLKVIKKILVGCMGLVFLLTASIFIYHKYQLNQESELIESKGTWIDFNSNHMNVYSEGSGEDTYVFMSGAGIAAPMYEMKGLYSKFSTENKIAVIERAGYGYSDVFQDKREIDTILEQSREALIQSGHKPPYILVPHSLSGIEAIYWAQTYPDEIKGIIALDIGLPQEYVDYRISLADSLTIRGMNVLTKMGFQRLFPSATYDPEVIKQSFLTEQEKEIYKAISYKQAFNDDMEQEILQSYDNAKKSVELPLPHDTPILFLSAYTDQNKDSKFTKQNNKNYLEFAEQLARSEVIRMKGKHSIYLYAPDEIYNLATHFINE